MKLLLLSLLFWGQLAKAYVLNLDYAAMKVSKLLCNRDYLVPELDCKDWRGAVGLDLDMSTASLLGIQVVMDNNIHAEGTAAKFKTVGWHYLLGLEHVPSGIGLGWEHHSRHVFDQYTPYVFSEDLRSYVHNRFPIYDAIYLKFTLYRRKDRD